MRLAETYKLSMQQSCRRLESPLNFSGFDAGSANFHLFDGVINFSSNRLQIRQPASLCMWVVVRTQEGVTEPGLWSLIADVATFSHLPNSQKMRLICHFTQFERLKARPRDDRGP